MVVVVVVVVGWEHDCGGETAGGMVSFLAVMMSSFLATNLLTLGIGRLAVAACMSSVPLGTNGMIDA